MACNVTQLDNSCCCKNTCVTNLSHVCVDASTVKASEESGFLSWCSGLAPYLLPNTDGASAKIDMETF